MAALVPSTAEAAEVQHEGSYQVPQMLEVPARGMKDFQVIKVSVRSERDKSRACIEANEVGVRSRNSRPMVGEESKEDESRAQGASNGHDLVGRDGWAKGGGDKLQVPWFL